MLFRSPLPFLASTLLILLCSAVDSPTRADDIAAPGTGFGQDYYVGLVMGEGFGWDEHEAVALAEKEVYAKVEALVESYDHVIIGSEGIVTLEPAFRATYGAFVIAWNTE